MTFAELSGICVIENVRALPKKPNTVVFDAHFFSGDSIGLLGYIEFYNRQGLNIESELPMPFYMDGTVAKCCPTISGDIVDGNAKEYDLVGHAHRLLQLPSNTDPRQLAYVRVCDGPDLASVNCTEGSFDIDAGQWTRPTEKEGSLPIHAVFPTPCRYGTNPESKPFPQRAGPIVVEGVLKGATRGNDNEVNRFQVEIEYVHFLNTSRRPVTDAQGVSGDPSPKRKRTAFTYDNALKSSPNMASSSKETAATTEPAQDIASGSSTKPQRTRKDQTASSASKEASASG